jgi:hypothetical protein
VGGIGTVIQHTESDRREAHRWARTNQVLYYVLGIAGIVAGLVAGSSAIADRAVAVTAIAGFLAAGLAAIQTFVDPKRKADAYWRKVFDLRDLLVREQTAAQHAQEPTDEMVDGFAAELAAISKRPLMAPDGEGNAA